MDNNLKTNKSKESLNDIQCYRIILEYYIEIYMKLKISIKKLSFYQNESNDKDLLDIYRNYIKKKLESMKLEIIKELKNEELYIMNFLITSGYFLSKENLNKLTELWKELFNLLNFY